MANASFSTNESKTFIHIADDNRVHMWDTDRAKERASYVEKHHLGHSYTCSAWKGGKKDNLGYFAVGASDGTVVVWDLTRGVVSKVLGTAHESPVPSSVVFASDAKSLLVASSSHHSVLRYDLASGAQTAAYKMGKRGISTIALNPKADVLAVGG